MKTPSKQSVISLLIGVARDIQHSEERLRQAARDTATEAKWDQRREQMIAFARELRAWSSELEAEHYDDIRARGGRVRR